MAETPYMKQYRARIEAMPRVYLICGRALLRGPNAWEFGLAWGKNPDAELGTYVYRHEISICVEFSIRRTRR